MLKTYGGILDGTVQLVDFDGQRLVVVEGQRQGFDFRPWFNTSVQLYMSNLYPVWVCPSMGTSKFR